jgi:hypothetical protein
VDFTNIQSSRIDVSDKIVITGTNPTLYLKDTNQRSGMIHMNSNRMYFLSGVTNSESYSQINAQWPLYLQTDTNQAVFGGNIVADQQTRFLATLAGTSDVTFNGNQNIGYTLQFYAVGGGYKAPTAEYTVPVTGNYIFYASFFTTNASCTVDLQKNGLVLTRVAAAKYTDSTNSHTTGAVFSTCSAGDIIRVRVINGSPKLANFSGNI